MAVTFLIASHISQMGYCRNHQPGTASRQGKALRKACFLYPKDQEKEDIITESLFGSIHLLQSSSNGPIPPLGSKQCVPTRQIAETRFPCWGSISSTEHAAGLPFPTRQKQVVFWFLCQDSVNVIQQQAKPLPLPSISETQGNLRWDWSILGITCTLLMGS